MLPLKNWRLKEFAIHHHPTDIAKLSLRLFQKSINSMKKIGNICRSGLRQSEPSPNKPSVKRDVQLYVGLIGTDLEAYHTLIIKKLTRQGIGRALHRASKDFTLDL